MEHLPIGLTNLVQILTLDRTRQAGHEQNPTLDLILVRVPELLLIIGESQEESLRDEVLEANELSIGLGAVVDEALTHLLILVRAVMVSFDLTCHVVRVEVEGAEVLVNLVNGAEVLDGGGCGFEHGCSGLGWLTGDSCESSRHFFVLGWSGLCESVRELKSSTGGFDMKEAAFKSLE